LKTTFATTGNGMDLHTEKVDSSLNAFPKNEISSKNFNIVLNSFINTKFSAKHTNKSGFVITNMNYNMLLKDATTGTPLQTIVDEKGSSTLVSAFSNSMVHITDNVSINVGLTGQWFTYNNVWSVEPRVGIKI
jgi:hypothetical protein